MSALHPGTRAVLPRRVVYRNGFSRTLDLYQKVLSRTRLYIGRPLVNNCALDNTTTNLSSHVPCVYQETPLGFLVQLRKTIWLSCLEKYTKNNIWGDYYACTSVVYHKLHLLDNPGEARRLLRCNQSCRFSLGCNWSWRSSQVILGCNHP